MVLALNGGKQMPKKEIIGVIAVILLGMAISAKILFSDRPTAASIDAHGHSHGDNHKHESDRGKHGGKMLTEGDFEVELVTFDNGHNSHFRVYPYYKHKPVDPSQVSVTMETELLDTSLKTYAFKPLDNFLVSELEIDGPKSFFIKLTAKWKDNDYEWEFSQYEGRLSMASELVKRMGIDSDLAQSKQIRTTLTLPGELVLNTDKASRIVPRVSGYVRQSLKNLGDPVKKDEIIAWIDSRELGEAKSQYLLALEREKLARYNYERSQQLWEKQTVPEKEFLTSKKMFLEEKIGLTSATRKLIALGLTEEEIQKLEEGSLKDLTHYPIRAPFDGVIVKKNVANGDWLKDDAEIYVVADLSTVWAEIIVYPSDLESVRLGQKAIIKATSSDMVTNGQVSYIDSVIGDESRTARARVVLENPDGKWRPGLFVKVEIIKEEQTVPVAVRNDAIQNYHDKPVVFVRYEDTFEARPIKLGRSDGHFTQIIAGLSPGESYVTKNSYILKSELGKSGMSHQH